MKVRILAIFLVIIAGLAAAIYAIRANLSVKQEYNSYIAHAEANAEKDIPYVSAQWYQRAFSVRSDDETAYRAYLEQCEELGDSFYEDAVKRYPVLFPSSAEAHEALCEFYYDENNYKALFKAVANARENGAATEKIRDMFYETAYQFKYIKTGVDEAWSFLGDTALVEVGGLYGFIDSSGYYAIAPVYSEASQFLSGYAAVNDGDLWYLINREGFKVAVTDKPVTSLSFLSNERIRIGIDGKYDYIGTNMIVPETLRFDQASNFKNGVAAVQKDGKWALIGADGKMITDFVFEDVILDENETCINNGVIFVKVKGSYYMADRDGNKISQNAFEDAYPFVSTDPAAVCVDGKWGFADAEGNMIIEPTYDEAKSFSENGLAPVCENDLWGYINPNGEYMIEAQFSDCKPFNSYGIAAVEEEGMWNYIELYLNYYT